MADLLDSFIRQKKLDEETSDEELDEELGEESGEEPGEESPDKENFPRELPQRAEVASPPASHNAKKRSLEGYMESNQAYIKLEDTESYSLGPQQPTSASIEEELSSTIVVDMIKEGQSPYCFTCPSPDIDLSEQAESPSSKRQCSIMTPTHGVQPDDACLPTLPDPPSPNLSSAPSPALSDPPSLTSQTQSDFENSLNNAFLM